MTRFHKSKLTFKVVRAIKTFGLSMLKCTHIQAGGHSEMKPLKTGKNEQFTLFGNLFIRTCSRWLACALRAIRMSVIHEQKTDWVNLFMFNSSHSTHNIMRICGNWLPLVRDDEWAEKPSDPQNFYTAYRCSFSSRISTYTLAFMPHSPNTFGSWLCAVIRVAAAECIGRTIYFYPVVFLVSCQRRRISKTKVLFLAALESQTYTPTSNGPFNPSIW